MTTISLDWPLLARSSALPGDPDGPSGPAVNRRVAAPGAGDLPIWSCSVRGFACHPCCHERGALLPHLFTLTHQRWAVYFLCHFPSGHPDRALPGASPCGVRTFLCAHARTATVWLTANPSS